MKKIKSINSIHIVPQVVFGSIKNSLRHPKTFRKEIIGGIMTILKLQGASSVKNIGLDSLPGTREITLNFSVDSYDRAVLCTIARLVQPKTFFEIGTYLGDTTLALAKCDPCVDIYTLDLPSPDSRKSAVLEMSDECLFDRWDRGSAFKDTPESKRIKQLTGDSATFDFGPYFGKIDMAFIDASHTYSYVKSDTEAVLKILSSTGTIVWHDYPSYPGVYAYLNELGATLSGTIYHIIGTGLAFWSRTNLLEALPKPTERME